MIRCFHWLSIMLVLGLLGISLTTEGQQPTHVYRIGRLSSERPNPANLEAFRQGLRDLG